jgi:uncharacterized damage-inducible protein DinB
MGAVTWKAPDVERPQGPLTGPERPMLQAFLDWHRATLLFKCAGLTGEQLADRAVPPSGLSLLGLVRHMTKVERTWFRRRFAGESVDDPFGGDKTADFERADRARAAADYARLTEEFKLADAAVAHASLDDTFTHNNELMSLRLIYLHMIEEYARHLGHADLLREQIDGATGELPRAWSACGGDLRTVCEAGPSSYRRGVTVRRPRAFRCRPPAGAAARVRRRPRGHGRSSPPSGPPRISPPRPP